MKAIYFIAFFAAMSLKSQTECDGPRFAREAVSSIAAIYQEEKISDMRGVLIESGEQKTYLIWAHYRRQNHSDRYEVSIDERNCQLKSIRLIEQNGPLKDGESSWHGEIKNLSLKTTINSSALSQAQSYGGHRGPRFATYLALPDLSLYTNKIHTKAVSETYVSHDEYANQSRLITQLIEESRNSGGYLDVSYSIEIKNSYYYEKEEASDFDYLCLKYRGHLVTVKFHNGLVLRSKIYELLGEAPESSCKEHE